ncbi:hypothetical protein ACQKQA_15925 [Pseudomonas sp. NPDC089530]|uniref:hypothetical protein n=1 Tax=Pseudomonas sp. NPDC089530 TaxID=3390651 RepID=UPI003CFC819C
MKHDPKPVDKGDTPNYPLPAPERDAAPQGLSKRAKLLSLVVVALVSLLCFSSLAQSAEGQIADSLAAMCPGALGGNDGSGRAGR